MFRSYCEKFGLNVLGCESTAVAIGSRVRAVFRGTESGFVLLQAELA